MTRKRLFYWVAGSAAALLLALVLILPRLVPVDALRGQIESRVSDATGRAFRIHGALGLTLFPSIGLDARDVTLANAPGGKAADMVRIDRMRIAARLWPLFSGRIEAGEIVLERPVIALEVAPDGTANWTLKAKSGKRLGNETMTRTDFAGLRIEKASITYDNARLGIHRALGDLDAKVTLTRFSAPATATGSLSFLGRNLDYNVQIATPQSLVDGRATKVDLALNADFLHAGFIGFVSASGTLKGSATLRTASLKDVAAWLGHPVSAGSGLGPLSLIAAVAAKDRRIVLTGIQAKLDGMSIKGAATADTTAKVPLVNANLDIDRLDLNTYLSFGHSTGGGPAPHGPPGGGWSRTPIRLDLVKLLDGHLTLITGALAVQHLKLGTTTIAVTLDGGQMKAHLEPMALYGGSGVADLTVDAHGPVPVFTNRLVFKGIAMQPFLADAIGVDRIEGPGTITLDVAAQGASPDAIMHALAGKGAVAIGPGRVRGVDMGRVARTVATILSAGATGQGAETAFDRFGGSFAIAGGVLVNRDLKLDSAFLHMTGAGSLDLGAQTIAYRIEPKAAIGGKLDLLDVGVPFDITGPWSHVRYKPDLAGAVTGLVGSVLDKGTAPLGTLLDGLTGSQQKPGGKKKSTGDTLKSLFGLH